MIRALALALAIALVGLAAACGGEAEPDAAGEERAELERVLQDARERAYDAVAPTEQDAGELEAKRDEVRGVADELAAADVPEDLAEPREAAVTALRELADRLEGAARSAEEDPTGVVPKPELDRLVRRPLQRFERALDEFRDAGYDVPVE